MRSQTGACTRPRAKVPPATGVLRTAQKPGPRRRETSVIRHGSALEMKTLAILPAQIALCWKFQDDERE